RARALPSARAVRKPCARSLLSLSFETTIRATFVRVCAGSVPNVRLVVVRVRGVQLVTLPVRVHLRAITTALHRAPRARLVLRRVEERPAAVVRPARLHALPDSVDHLVVDLDEDPADRTAHPADGRLDAR